MKIGLLSDTHGNESLLHTALEYLVNQYKVDKLYHLGDNYHDGNTIKAYDVPLVQVPGLYCQQYICDQFPNLIIDETNEVKIGLIHDFAQLEKENQNRDKFDILCFGHTHQYDIFDHAGEAWMVNPGHLKNFTDRNSPATFGILEIGDQVNVKIISTNDQVLLSKQIRI